MQARATTPHTPHTQNFNTRAHDEGALLRQRRSSNSRMQKLVQQQLPSSHPRHCMPPSKVKVVMKTVQPDEELCISGELVKNFNGSKDSERYKEAIDFLLYKMRCVGGLVPPTKDNLFKTNLYIALECFAVLAELDDQNYKRFIYDSMIEILENINGDLEQYSSYAASLTNICEILSEHNRIEKVQKNNVDVLCKIAKTYSLLGMTLLQYSKPQRNGKPLICGFSGDFRQKMTALISDIEKLNVVQDLDLIAETQFARSCFCLLNVDSNLLLDIASALDNLCGMAAGIKAEDYSLIRDNFIGLTNKISGAKPEFWIDVAITMRTLGYTALANKELVQYLDEPRESLKVIVRLLETEISKDHIFPFVALTMDMFVQLAIEIRYDGTAREAYVAFRRFLAKDTLGYCPGENAYIESRLVWIKGKKRFKAAPYMRLKIIEKLFELADGYRNKFSLDYTEFNEKKVRSEVRYHLHLRQNDPSIVNGKSLGSIIVAKFEQIFGQNYNPAWRTIVNKWIEELEQFKINGPLVNPYNTPKPNPSAKKGKEEETTQKVSFILDGDTFGTSQTPDDLLWAQAQRQFMHDQKRLQQEYRQAQFTAAMPVSPPPARRSKALEKMSSLVEPRLMDAKLQTKNRVNAKRAVKKTLEIIASGGKSGLDDSVKLITPNYDDLQAADFNIKAYGKASNELLAPFEILKAFINLNSDIRFTENYQKNGYIVAQGVPKDETENFEMNALDEEFRPMHWNGQIDANGFSKYVEEHSPSYIHETGFGFHVHMAAFLNQEKYMDDHDNFNEALYLKHMGKLFELMFEEQYQSGATDIIWDGFGLAEVSGTLQLELAKEFVKAFTTFVNKPRDNSCTTPKLHLCLPVYNDKMINARRAMLKALKDAQEGIYTFQGGRRQLKPVFADKFVLHVEEGLSDPISIAQKLAGLDVDAPEEERTNLKVSLACAVHAEKLGGNWQAAREYNPASLEQNLHLRSPLLAEISELLNRTPDIPNQPLLTKLNYYSYKDYIIDSLKGTVLNIKSVFSAAAKLLENIYACLKFIITPICPIAKNIGSGSRAFVIWLKNNILPRIVAKIPQVSKSEDNLQGASGESQRLQTPGRKVARRKTFKNKTPTPKSSSSSHDAKKASEETPVFESFKSILSLPDIFNGPPAPQAPDHKQDDQNIHKKTKPARSQSSSSNHGSQKKSKKKSE